jgi:hypothetical protein
MGLPLTQRRALLSLLLRRSYIRLRGLRFRERPAHEIAPEELERVDVCYSVVRGLGFIDPVGAIEFQARHLLRALELGEPYRIVRALTFEATSASTRRRDRPRAERLLQTARELGERIQHPHAIGLCWSTTGLVDLMAGRWKRAWDALRRAEGIFRQHGATHSYDIVVSHIHGLNALSYAGEFKEYFRWVPEFLEESKNRGDRYAETNLRMHNACRLCFQHGDPDAARVEVQQAMAGWSRQRVSMEHATELLRQAEFFLYEGKPDRALDLVDRHWKSSFAPLLLFGIQIWVIAALNVRARVALGMAATAEGRSRARFLAAAERDARRLERQRTHWAGALACLIRAGVASMSGRADRALGLLVASEARFRDADMALHAAVAARQRGALLGGDSGRALAAEADTWILGQGLKDPSRMSAMIAPGLAMPA